MKVQHAATRDCAYAYMTAMTNAAVVGLDVFGGEHYQDTVGKGVAFGAAAINALGGVVYCVSIFDENTENIARNLLIGTSNLVSAGGLIVQGFGAPIQGAVLTGVGVGSNLLLNYMFPGKTH